MCIYIRFIKIFWLLFKIFCHSSFDLLFDLLFEHTNNTYFFLSLFYAIDMTYFIHFIW